MWSQRDGVRIESGAEVGVGPSSMESRSVVAGLQVDRNGSDRGYHIRCFNAQSYLFGCAWTWSSASVASAILTGRLFLDGSSSGVILSRGLGESGMAVFIDTGAWCARHVYLLGRIRCKPE